MRITGLLLINVMDMTRPGWFPISLRLHNVCCCWLELEAALLAELGCVAAPLEAVVVAVEDVVGVVAFERTSG